MTPRLVLALAAALVPAAVFAAGPPAEPLRDRYGDPLPAGAVARYGSTRLVHAGVERIDFSPGGKLLASLAHEELRVWDAKTGRLLLRLPAPRAFALTPDGLVLAQEHEVRLVDVAAGKVRRTLDRHDGGGEIVAVAVTPDGKTAAVAWGARGTLVYDLTAPGEAGPRQVCPERLDKVCLSADGRRLAGFDRDEVQVWDVATAGKLQAIKLEGERQWKEEALALSADGGRVAAAHREQVHVWLTATGKPPEGFAPPEGAFRFLRFSADGKTLTGLHTKGVVVWSAETGKEQSAHGERTGRAVPRALADDGVTVAGNDQHVTRINVWNVRTGEERLKHDPPPSKVRFVQPDLVASEIPEKRACLWSATDGKLQKELDGPHWGLSPDGRYLATNAKEPEKEVTITEVATGKVVSRLAADGVQSFTPDGRTIVTWVRGKQGTFHLWDVATGRLLRTLGKTDDVPEDFNLSQFSPDGRTLVGEGYKQVIFYELATGKEREKLKAPANPEALKYDEGRTEFRFARDGRTLLVMRPRDLYVTSCKAGGPVFQLLTAYMAPSALSPDGRWLATGNRSAVEVRDLRSNRAAVEWQQLDGHEGEIKDLCFSPDGRSLVSASDDGTALVWDMRPLVERAGRRPQPPEDTLLAEWWAALGGEAEKAGAAMAALESYPDRAVTLAAARLAPVKEPAPGEVAKWVADLDSGDFDRRAKATKELGRLAELAEPALREALKKGPSAELKSRAEGLLERLGGEETVPERLQALRAVELLERIGTAEARKVLEGLAKGAPDAKLTKDAKASLARWPTR
jgi:WD40 repeat protein